MLRVIGAAVLGLLPSALVPASARAADVEAGSRTAEVCAPCHGPDGNSTRPDVPSLAGQQSLYLQLQLVQFREKRRTDPQMSPFAASLTDADIQDLAAYFAAQAPRAERRASDPRRVAAGRLVAERHHCASCHAPGLAGQQHVPRLAGQHPEYLMGQLRGFKAQTRADIDGSMTTAAQPLSDEDIENLAHYIAGLTSAKNAYRGAATRTRPG